MTCYLSPLTCLLRLREGLMHDLRHVKTAAPGELHRLLPAGEAVGYEKSVRLLWKKIQELVAEDGGAGRLEDDEGSPRADLVPERVEDPPEVIAREVDHPRVVEGTAAAETGGWKGDREAGIDEDGGGGRC